VGIINYAGKLPVAIVLVWKGETIANALTDTLKNHVYAIANESVTEFIIKATGGAPLVISRKATAKAPFYDSKLNTFTTSPVPGDAIVAFISRGRGVIVHTRQCPKAFNLDPARSVEVSWDNETRQLRPVAVEVVSEDKPGILAALSKCFMEHGVNIAQAKCRATDDNRGLNTFQVTVSHVDQLHKVLRAIQGIDGVISAIRL